MKIGVLGSGQLGRMLALSAYPLGHQMCFLASSEENPSEDTESELFKLNKTLTHYYILIALSQY